MLKTISDLSGVKQLSKLEQQKVNGGGLKLCLDASSGRMGPCEEGDSTPGSGICFDGKTNLFNC
ncbi:hypothetical protein [Tenacibaculum ovolyticum]|uniref:hypothetical protein n=1 Tax=Tenacibaculum ovolyticum TaxID=104270 RepID=UPI001F365FB8|nr:hypothetical protein [Tenacibaculum ovolyticum]